MHLRTEEPKPSRKAGCNRWSFKCKSDQWRGRAGQSTGSQSNSVKGEGAGGVQRGPLAALSGWTSEGKKKRKEARSASQTGTRNSPSLPGPASNPFAGSRPCLTAPLPLLPCCRSPQGASPSSYNGYSAQTGPLCSDGAKHLSPQGLCTGCCSCLDPFLPSPLCCPFLTTLHFSSFRSVSRSREGLSALQRHIPLPQHPRLSSKLP